MLFYYNSFLGAGKPLFSPFECELASDLVANLLPWFDKIGRP
jgi:hypothetical protein